jgi:hypothetical protein
MKSKLRVAVIGTTGLPARYGGFETLAHHLVDQLGPEVDVWENASQTSICF